MIQSKYIVWGSAGHAKVLHDLIREIGGSICCLVDNSANAEAILTDVPLLHGESELRRWYSTLDGRDEISGAIAIGGDRSADRRQIASILIDLGIKIPALVHPRAVVSNSARIGGGSQILANALVAAGCTIGEHAIINHSANIDHECKIDDGVHVAPGAVLCGCVRVLRDAFIGAGATVLPRITIGKCARVGAGALVTRDVRDDSTVIGVPAREREI